MTKVLLGLVLVLTFFQAVPQAGWRARRERRVAHFEKARMVSRVVSGGVLRRTRRVIMFAQVKSETGDRVGLGRAVGHQLVARRLHFLGFYRRSVFHSLWARRIALRVIARNGDEKIAEAEPDRDEKELEKELPSEEALEKDLDEEGKKTLNSVDDQKSTTVKLEEAEEEK